MSHGYDVGVLNEGGDFASHVYVGLDGRASRQWAGTAVRCGIHGRVYFHAHAHGIRVCSQACAPRLERRYEQGGLPACSGRRPLTEAAGCAVRRLGGEGASVADIEGQTREGGE